MANSSLQEAQRMAHLLSALAHQQLTAEEKAELDAWIAANPDNKALADRLQDPGYRNSVFSTWKPDAAEVSLQRVKQRIGKVKERSFIKRLAAAAIILLAGAGITYFQLQRPNNLPAIAYKNDVGPGADKAILTLADGRKISLTDAPDGQLANPTGITIVKATNGDLVYQVSNVPGKNPEGGQHPLYNTVETPAGGQHRILLPDGTRVWLNALSTLKFPQNFTGLKERVIQLSGEAYFEVAPDKAQPFIVKTPRQETAVLGTHFDIRSYKEDLLTSTTLLEGSIRSTDTRSSLSNILKPGEQFLTNEQNSFIRQVDTLAVIDWKNGEFIFHNENIRDMMRRIARWYDVEVIFRDYAAGQETFSGSVSRYDNISQLLKTLQLTGRVKFDIDGKKIFVSK